ncbi:MAG: ATP-binding protein [Chloroflexota bacterium]|nr:ATP-binding protein [Chloroflexota bacterium]
MTQNISENFPEFELSREEGIQSVLTLINLIPDPALIYHRGNDKILTANNPLYLLTNLGEMDFIGGPIRTLLPNIIETDPIGGHNKQALLRHKKQPLIPVNVRIFSLTHTNETLLIVLKPEEIQSNQKHTIVDQTELLNKLHVLVKAEHGLDFGAALQTIIIETASILSADVVCLYTASGSKPQLDQYLSNDERFSSELPASLSKDDLTNTEYPSLWNPGKPAVTHLQKTASNSGFQFLSIVPLGNETNKYGLLVAGGKVPNQNPNFLLTTQVLAGFLSRTMAGHIAQQNLRTLANRIKQVVKIQGEIIENIEEGVIILSPDLTIAEMNPAAETFLGYANVEALRQNINTILIGSESLGSAFTSAQQGIPTLTGGDLTLHHRNGNSFPAQVLMSPVMKNGQLLSIIILIRDISEQEQSQATNKQLEQRAILGEVTAIFAHEVRNPINAIMLSLQVMEENLQSDNENLKWIENMRDECHKLLYLMDSVLSFAKPLEYKMSQVDLDEMLTRLLERWRPRLLRLNISSFYETEVENPTVEGDLRALDQVFTNLISNSVNAMSEEGGSLGIKISITDHEENHQFLKVTLTDSGHGIPDEIKAHMFKPFVTGSAHGTGLGLAITQRIINAHKGKIEVDSFAGGTIFKIYLKRWKGYQN